MESILVSVIVPIYNVENELKRCLDSLMNQTLTDIEIILVDDGSFDNSPKICDEYAQIDNKIKVFHKKNGGLSDARNFGLSKARGQYVLFVDSDDYINSDTCKILFSHAVEDNLDIVIGDAVIVEQKKYGYMRHSKSSLNKIMKGNEFLKEQLRGNSMHMAVWLNLYNRKFIINNELLFKIGILHEDEQFTPRVFLKAKKVKYIGVDFYNYIIRDNSITKAKDKEKNGIDLINTCYELESIYNKIEDDELRILLLDNLVTKYLSAIHVCNLYNKKYDNLYNNSFFIGKPKTIKNKFKVILFVLNKKLYKYVNNINKKSI